MAAECNSPEMILCVWRQTLLHQSEANWSKAAECSPVKERASILIFQVYGSAIYRKIDTRDFGVKPPTMNGKV